jgi:CTP:molybdopterin cytidylyltransferase MocA
VKVAAIVLAGGAGTRMGGPKALLPWGARSLLSAVCELVARPAVAAVIAVVGHEADRVVEQAGLPASVRIVVNPRPEDGMLSSIVTGLDEAAALGMDAVMLQPVDHPAVAARTIDAVREALESGAVVAVPSHGGRRGHPAGFARAAWDALRGAPPETGARAVLAAHPEWVVHVPGDEGCRAGINTPEDYRRLARLTPPAGGGSTSSG